MAHSQLKTMEEILKALTLLSHADAGEDFLLLLPFRREKAGMRVSSKIQGA